MFSNYRTNKRYLNQYYIAIIGLLAVTNGVLYFFQAFDWESFLLFLPAVVLLTIPNISIVVIAWFYTILLCVFRSDFDVFYLAYIPLAVFVTFTASAILHSASHSSIRPRWLGRISGELVGLWQLNGFPLWVISHILHHQHSDDPVLDPHPPMDKSYWRFLVGMRESVLTVTVNHYFSLWGKNEESIRNLKELALESKVAVFLQVIFWYQVLGPQIFTFFFVFAVAFKMAHYAWFNYATHVHTKDGTIIVNLDQGLYKIVNFFGFGLYYHKNHHLKPGLFDPRKLSPEK